MTRWIYCIIILFTIIYIDTFNISIPCFWPCHWDIGHLTLIICNFCSILISKNLTMCTKMGTWVLMLLLNICTMTREGLGHVYINTLTLLTTCNIVTRACPPLDVG